ncbi:MAG TPA: type IX secretion system protein PorQ [Draconibacterium sp.]|nr:type IX secretion system protein PorQ [Draconibacterium sp.]
MKQKFYLIIIFCFSMLFAKAQIGGENTYQFLELTNSARIAALGGNQIAILDTTDLNLPYHNPAALHKGMANKVLVNYVNYMTDINYGYASYAKSFNGIGNFALGMHYINYGDFKEATEFGQLTGNKFKAAEYSMHIIYSNNYKRINYGAALKPILSSFESYQSVGIAADFGVSIASKSNSTNVSFVARNVGSQITTYYDNGDYEKIPLNIQAGVSRRLQHAPINLALNMQYLNHWDLGNPEPDVNSEEETDFFKREEGFGKQIMRHVVFGVEILPSQNFIIRAGYNYQRRQELKFSERPGMVGFSAGFGLKIKRFHLDYGISQFHLAGSSNLFSLAINLNNNF